VRKEGKQQRLSGKAHGRYKHGRKTKEAIEERKRLAALMREVKDTMNLCDAQQRIVDEIDRCSNIKGHCTLSKIILAAKERVL